MSNYNPTPRIENIAHEAIQILNTLALLDQAYSMGYVVRILQADERYKFRKVAHRDLETFGTLEDLNFSRIEDIMHHLVHLGLIEVKNQLYGTVALTDQGREFLVKPYDIEVAQSDLYRGWAVIQLSIGLRGLRRDAAEKAGRPPYEFFTNYVLDTIARRMPTTVEQLDTISGMKNLAHHIREEILAEVNRVKELIAKDEASDGVYRKSFSPGHRKIRELFEAEFSVEEIARRRNLRPATVRSYLADLYEAGMLDLKPWIEREVESTALHKGIEYFRSTQSPQIDEARQVLGYDFDVLRLCRAYASQAQEPEATYAT